MTTIYGVFLMHEDEYISEQLIGLFENIEEAEEVGKSFVIMENIYDHSLNEYRWKMFRPYIGLSSRHKLYSKNAEYFKEWYIGDKKFCSLVIIEQLHVQKTNTK